MAAPFKTYKYFKEYFDLVCKVSNQDFFSSRSPTSLGTHTDFQLLFHSTVFFFKKSIHRLDTPTCDVCFSRDIRQLSTEKLLQNHMDLYTDSHHSEITQVMCNKVYTDDQSWDYTCIFSLQGVGVRGPRKKYIFLYRQAFTSEKH